MTKPTMTTLPTADAPLSAERKEWSVDDLTHFLRDWFASHETDEGVALDPEIIADAILYEADTYRTKAPTLSADRNAVIEECAKVADRIGDSHAYSAAPMISGQHDGARKCARAIRALKQ